MSPRPPCVCQLLALCCGWLLHGTVAYDLDKTNYCKEPALVRSLEELTSNTDWFAAQGTDGPPNVIIVDDFYSDSEFQHVLSRAEASSYTKYFPPDESWGWNSSCLYVLIGDQVDNAFEGGRYCPDHLRKRMEEIIGEDIDPVSWPGTVPSSNGGLPKPTAGDGWNGVFHRFNSRWQGGAVHHHWKVPDVAPRGWSGLVYLSDHEADSCTSIWLERNTSSCVGRYGSDFEFYPKRRFDLAFTVPAKRNRLLLFREGVFHRAERGFDFSYRLTQTFFFLSEPRSEKRQEL